jgi:chromosome partitioning protein
MLSINQANKISGVPISTLQGMIKDGRIIKNENGIDKISLLQAFPTVLTLFNQKGGVGKTSTSVLLADYFEKKDLKILLIDLDPQSNLTQFYFDEVELSLYDFLEQNTLLNKIVKTYNKNIDIIPASVKMTRKEMLDFTYALEKRDDFKSIFKKYQIIIIDCPPTLNFLSRLGINLANYIFIPLLAEPLSYEGLSETLKTIKILKSTNPCFIDYKAIINNFKPIKTIVRKNYYDTIKSKMNKQLFDINLPEFIGIVERFPLRKNLFELYNNETTKKIEDLFNLVYNYIYEERE